MSSKDDLPLDPETIEAESEGDSSLRIFMYREALEHVSARLASAEALLREVENGIAPGGLCPLCGAYRMVRRDGTVGFSHVESCRLASFLASGRER